ncbi:uncharacterized protein si:dkey-183i3.6 [Notolabrus celidotus]|uniref:uncharacterized protein si:dkey-183i3.6 n=1 Tax=Notolabrus celidotus TaxID=1203425 RepID=UPI0014901419|nr:uncharacterized protein si:dkey-183i3.6 [Notolabrus celidotus]
MMMMMTSKPHGMIGNSGVLTAVLAVVSVLSLSLLSLFCLRCKKKSKIIHEEHQIYNPDTFQRGGSRFAVIRSKTVTRASPLSANPVESGHRFEEYPHLTDGNDDPSDYQNIGEAHTGSAEHTYVAPLPITVYENENTKKQITDMNQALDVYVNVPSFSVNDDEDDYENSQFLQEQEEPDYVNEDGT